MVSLSQQDSVTITVSWCHYVIGIPTLSQMKKIRQLFIGCLYLSTVIYFLWLMHSFVTNGVSVLFDFCLTAGFTIRFDVIVLCNSFFHNEYISQCKDTISFLITIGLRYLCIHKSNENGNNMENFSELIKNRRSMRKFTDEELTQDEVGTDESCLNVSQFQT